MEVEELVRQRRADALMSVRRHHSRTTTRMRADADSWPPLVEATERAIAAFDQGLTQIESVIRSLPDMCFLEPWARAELRREIASWKRTWREANETIGSGFH